MSKSSNQLGIIYRIIESGYKDKIIHVLNINGSKDSLIAKGVRESKSKRSSSIELGNKVFYKNIETSGDLGVLGDVTVRESFVSDDYKKLILLQAFCEIVDRLAINEEKNLWLYNLFEEVLEFTKKSTNPIYVAYFIVKALNESGLLPDLSECMISSENILPGGVGCIDEQIGFINISSLNDEFLIQKVSDNIYKIIKFFLKSNLSEINKINVAKTEQSQILSISIKWFEIALEREFNSKNLLSTLTFE